MVFESSPALTVSDKANMKLSTRPLLLILFFTFLSTACTSGPKSKLFSSEKIWEESGINNYQISIQVVQSIWHLQIYNLTVKNDLVIDSSTSCIPAPYEGRECTIKSFDPDEFTIPALFSLAEQQKPSHLFALFLQHLPYMLYLILPQSAALPPNRYILS